MQERPLTEEEAMKEIERQEKEFGLKYPKREKEKEIRRLMGKEPWFR
jgi:hypothetical protein